MSSMRPWGSFTTPSLFFSFRWGSTISPEGVNPPSPLTNPALIYHQTDKISCVIALTLYGNAILAGLPALSLQRVLHATARTVLDLKPRDYVTPALLKFFIFFIFVR